MTGESPAASPLAGSSESPSQSRTPQNIQDRRAVPRTRMAMEFEAVLLDQPDQPSTRVILKDISTKGAAFHTSHLFRDDETLMIVMAFANRTGRIILARVRYCKKLGEGLYQAGSEFLDAMNMPRSKGPPRVPPKWLMPRAPKKP